MYEMQLNICAMQANACVGQVIAGKAFIGLASFLFTTIKGRILGVGEVGENLYTSSPEIY